MKRREMDDKCTKLGIILRRIQGNSERKDKANSTLAD